MDNVFTSTAVILPPQQQQSSAASALASLGNLAGMAGSLGGAIRTPGEQYASLLQSANIENRIIERFKLMEVYNAKLHSVARRQLQGNVRVSVGKKDGLISIGVDDKSPQRAADIANAYVQELRRLTGELALTEAQQRRQFFGRELENTKERLAQAQAQLEASGFNAGAIRAEPKATAEAYARLRAEITGVEVKLQVLRRGLAENSVEVQQQLIVMSALKQQLSMLEGSTARTTPATADYISRYREFKYQESLFELFSRQFEVARLDESREGALIQVVDSAAPADLKSRPGRSLIAIGVTIVVLLTYLIGLYLSEAYRRLQASK